jgi:RHS repeat-associated protein
MLSQLGLSTAAFTECSYTHTVILRDRDADEPWTSASDGALEERRFYCQNWRADVVAVTLSDGAPWEFVRYSSYGEPTVYPVADVNRDGIVNYDDMTAFGMGSTTGDFAATPDGEPDLDFDGDIGSSADIALFMDSYDANTGQNGKGRVSSAEMGNRKGYAGYEWDHVIAMSHVRYRVYWAEIGRWTRRDPIGYVDGPQLYAMVRSAPIALTDPDGRVALAGCVAGGVIGGAMGAMQTVASCIAGSHPNCVRKTACSAAGGALGGCIAGVAPSPLTGCIGGALGSIAESACNHFAGDTEQSMACALLKATANCLTSSVFGYAASAEQQAKTLAGFVGLTTSIFSNCDSFRANIGTGPGGAAPVRAAPPVQPVAIYVPTSRPTETSPVAPQNCTSADEIGGETIPMLGPSSI